MGVRIKFSKEKKPFHLDKIDYYNAWYTPVNVMRMLDF